MSSKFAASTSFGQALVAATTAFEKGYGHAPAKEHRRRKSVGEGTHFMKRRSSTRFSEETSHRRSQAAQISHDELPSGAAAAGASSAMGTPVRPQNVPQAPSSRPRGMTIAHPVQSTVPAIDGSLHHAGSLHHFERPAFHQSVSPTWASRGRGLPPMGHDVSDTSQSDATDLLPYAPRAVTASDGNTPEAQMYQSIGSQILEDSKDATPKPKLRAKPSMFMPRWKRTQDKSDAAAGDYRQGDVSYTSSTISGKPTATLPDAGPNSRSSSFSFKQTFRKVFRKSSQGSSKLPVQQVNATRLHFGDVDGSCDGDGVDPVNPQLDQADTRSSYTARSRSLRLVVPKRSSLSKRSRSRQSSFARSDDDASNARSRVTSWTDSTSTGTVRSHANAATTVHGGARQSQSLSKRREPRPSTERRAIESNRVSSWATKLAERNASTQQLHQEEEELASKSRDASVSSRIGKMTKATIRTVTPDHQRLRRALSKTRFFDHPVDDPPPVPSVPSNYDGNDPFVGDHTSARRPARLLAENTRKAPVPTSDQIANRMRRSTDRWQEQLEEKPFFTPSSSKKKRRSINPYELTPLDQLSPFASKDNSVPEAMANNNLQQHTGVHNQAIPSAAHGYMSPSIYSQHADAANRAHESAGSLAGSAHNGAGSALIVKSGSATAYLSDATAKAHAMTQSVNSSRDWRAWLSNEVADLSVLPSDDITIDDQFTPKATGHVREHAQIDEHDNTIGLAQTISGPSAHDQVSVSKKRDAEPRVEKTRLAKAPENSGIILGKKEASKGGADPTQGKRTRNFSRPKLESRSSSRMNERYPLIEKARNPSKQKLKGKEMSPPASAQQTSSRKDSSSSPSTTALPESEGDQNTSSPEPNQQAASTMKNIASMAHASRLPFSEPEPTQANRLQYARSYSSLARQTTTVSSVPTNPLPPTPPLRIVKASQSPQPPRVPERPEAHRARSSFELRDRYSPQPLRRKATIDTLFKDDPMLARIYRGPYGFPATPTTPSPQRNRALRQVVYKENSPATSIAAVVEGGADEERGAHTPTGGHKMADAFLRRRGELGGYVNGSPAFL